MTAKTFDSSKLSPRERKSYDAGLALIRRKLTAFRAETAGRKLLARKHPFLSPAPPPAALRTLSRTLSRCEPTPAKTRTFSGKMTTHRLCMGTLFG